MSPLLEEATYCPVRCPGSSRSTCKRTACQTTEKASTAFYRLGEDESKYSAQENTPTVAHRHSHSKTGDGGRDVSNWTADGAAALSAPPCDVGTPRRAQITTRRRSFGTQAQIVVDGGTPRRRPSRTMPSTVCAQKRRQLSDSRRL